MTDLAKLMQRVRPSAPSAVAAADSMAATPDPTPDLYTTSAGARLRMAEMNPHHRENAIRKAEREGNADLAARLIASRPKED